MENSEFNLEKRGADATGYSFGLKSCNELKAFNPLIECASPEKEATFFSTISNKLYVLNKITILVMNIVYIQ